jgi:hypothetical protein
MCDFIDACVGFNRYCHLISLKNVYTWMNLRLLKVCKGINYGQACVGTVVKYREVYGWPEMAGQPERRLGFD